MSNATLGTATLGTLTATITDTRTSDRAEMLGELGRLYAEGASAAELRWCREACRELGATERDLEQAV
jgi:hypothetical protein